MSKWQAKETDWWVEPFLLVLVAILAAIMAWDRYKLTRESDSPARPASELLARPGFQPASEPLARPDRIPAR